METKENSKIASEDLKIKMFRERIAQINNVDDKRDLDPEYGYYVYKDDSGKLHKEYFRPFPSKICYERKEFDYYYGKWIYNQKPSEWKMRINGSLFEENAEKIIEVKMPANLQVIEPETFAKCKNLTNVVFNNGLEEIGAGAFENTNVDELNFPSTLNMIEIFAFNNCQNLKTVNFQNGLNFIHNSAFSNTSLKSVNLPSSLVLIGENAFKDCCLLEELNMEYGIKEIDEAAFMGCTNLKEVILPDSITRIGDYLFNKCTSLEYVSFPKDLKNLPFILNGCTSLKFVKLPENVEGYRYEVFPKCENIVVEGKLQKDDDAFRKCRNVKKYSDEITF